MILRFLQKIFFNFSDDTFHSYPEVDYSNFTSLLLAFFGGLYIRLSPEMELGD